MTALLVLILLASAGIVVVTIRDVRAEHRRFHPPEPPPPPYGPNQFAAGCALATSTAVVGALVLAGVPGGVFLALVEMVTGAFGWHPVRDLAEGAWPVAIAVSFLWPIPIPFASRWFARRSPGGRRWARQSFALGVGFGWGVVVTLLFLLISAG